MLGCSFDGLLATCRMTIGGIPLEVSARINHCHTPIDVTFLVQSESTILKNFSPGTDDEEQPVEVRGERLESNYPVLDPKIPLRQMP